MNGRADTGRARGRHRRIAAVPWLWFSLVLLCFCAPRPAAAAGEPAKLEADEVVFHYGERRLTAEGNARLVYKDVVIEADGMEIDVESNTLTAKGHVKMRDGEQNLTADELTYDLTSEHGSIGAFRGQVQDGGITLHFSGQGLTQTEEKTTGLDLSLTTCGLDAPHYRFTAAKVEYYPGDRIILHKAFYWEGKLRLLYLPYLAVTLKDRQNSFRFPKAGYNASEGWFLKLAYVFFVGDIQSGVVLLDLMELKGIGEGLIYTWEYPSGTTLSGTIYHLGNKITGGDDYRLEGSLKLPLTGHNLHSSIGLADESLSAGGRSETRRFGLQLTPRAGGGTQATLNYLAHEAPAADDWSLDLSLSGNWQPWSGGRLAVSGRWYWLENGTDITRDNYRATMTHTWDRGSFLALLSSTASETRSESTGSTEISLSRILPQLRLELRELDTRSFLGRFNLALDYRHRFEESKYLSGDGERLEAYANAQPRTIAQGGPFTLNAGAYGQGILYDTGDTVFTAAPTLSLLTRVSPAWNLQSSLAWVFAAGEPPALFAGDRPTPNLNLNLAANYQKGRWNGRLSTGYAFHSELWRPLLANLSWSSPNGDQLGLTASYDLMAGALDQASLALGWRPRQDWSFRLNAGYDPDYENPWRQLDFMASIKQPLGDKIKLGLNARYDLFHESWTQAQTTVDYVWHCRTVSFGYDWTRAEFTLTVFINAFPQHPIKLAYSESGIYFTPPVLLP